MGWPLNFEVCRCGSMFNTNNIWLSHLFPENIDRETHRERITSKNRSEIRESKGRGWYSCFSNVKAMKIQMMRYPPKFPLPAPLTLICQVVRAAILFLCSLSNLISNSGPISFVSFHFKEPVWKSPELEFQYNPLHFNMYVPILPLWLW